MKILISDTHFGCRQNSITWLNSQLNFFYKQLIPFIEKQKGTVHLYHLGDVFDSRSSINPLVAAKVKKLFQDLYNVCDRIIIIGGNHDYYSPVENEENVNTLRLVLGELETDQFVIADKEFWEDTHERELFVPWFRYLDFDQLKDELSDGDFDRVFIHNDLTVTLEQRYRDLFKDYQVYSGHIHTPRHDQNLHTLGSTFALTFSDCNSDRGFYTMNDDGSDLQFHKNTESIRFYRFYNNEIFKNVNIQKEDYVEIYIDQSNLLKENFMQRIRELSEISNHLITIPRRDFMMNDDSTDFEQYDIADICRQNIPDHLIEKFNLINDPQKDY